MFAITNFDKDTLSIVNAFIGSIYNIRLLSVKNNFSKSNCFNFYNKNFLLISINKNFFFFRTFIFNFTKIMFCTLNIINNVKLVGYFHSLKLIYSNIFIKYMNFPILLFYKFVELIYGLISKNIYNYYIFIKKAYNCIGIYY